VGSGDEQKGRSTLLPTPYSPLPTLVASQAICPEVGRRSRASRLRPVTCDQYRRAQGRPARRRPGLPWRLSGQLTDQGRDRTPASPHPGPALALGWSVHRPGEVSGLRPPAPVLKGGSRSTAHLISEARTSSHFRAPKSRSVHIQHESQDSPPTLSPCGKPCPALHRAIGSPPAAGMASVASDGAFNWRHSGAARTRSVRAGPELAPDLIRGRNPGHLVRKIAPNPRPSRQW
jgi:hypothetical protein